MIKTLQFAIFIISVNAFSQAQVEKIFIKGDFHNMPLVDFIKEIQTKHLVQFHYVNHVVAKVQVNGIFKNNTPLTQVLEILLQAQPISFSVSNNNEIILFENQKKIIKPSQKLFILSGIVVDKHTAGALPYVTIHIPEASKGAVSDSQGKFEIKPLPKGIYLVHFSFVGYGPFVTKLYIQSDTTVMIALEENAMELKELIITPSMFEISTIEATPLTLGREEILHSPNMGKDIYRTLRALPGIANNDFSSKARIRGGHSDETAVYLDHFLINDAFHLEEIDGSFSIFNTDYVDELTVLTGGFSAKYTDRLSGIIDVKTFDHIEADKYRLSADLLNISLLVQKKINDKTNISLTARKGYLDFLLRKMDTDDTEALNPRFSDLWSKITYKANYKNSFSLNFLLGRDNFYYEDMDDFVAQLNLKNIRDNVNVWTNWKWFPSKNFSSITTLGYQLMQKTAHFIFPDNLSFNNVDENKTQSLVLTNNSFLDVTTNSSLEMGLEFRPFGSYYKYKELRYDAFNSKPDEILIYDINIDTEIDGYTAAAYLQYNWTITKGLIVQPGLRASSQSFSSELKWAPRLALSYDILPSFTTKLAYGIYYQPDLFYKLRTSLFQDRPFERTGQATHYTGSLNYSKSRTHVMLNVYYKEYEYLFDDYRFEFFNRVGGVNILDIPFNTNSGYAQGAEIMVRQNYGKKSMLSFSYVYAKSRIRNLSGEEAYRDFDQPHTFILNNIFRLPKAWNISLFWTYHTGYPYTPTQVDFINYRPDNDGMVIFYEAGIKNSKRLSNYHSLDIRIEKSWYVRKNIISAYLNIVNLYNRENPRSYWWSPAKGLGGAIYFEPETQTNIPFFISPGISFTMH